MVNWTSKTKHSVHIFESDFSYVMRIVENLLTLILYVNFVFEKSRNIVTASYFTQFFCIFNILYCFLIFSVKNLFKFYIFFGWVVYKINKRFYYKNNLERISKCYHYFFWHFLTFFCKTFYLLQYKGMKIQVCLCLVQYLKVTKISHQKLLKLLIASLNPQGKSHHKRDIMVNPKWTWNNLANTELHTTFRFYQKASFFMNNNIPNFRENYYYTKQKKRNPFIINYFGVRYYYVLWCFYVFFRALICCAFISCI